MSDQGYIRASFFVKNVLSTLVKLDMEQGLKIIHALAPELDGPSADDLQATRVLLTDAAALFQSTDDPRLASLGKVWRQKYEELIPRLGSPTNPFDGKKLDGSDEPKH
jgi:hypothetical protein